MTTRELLAKLSVNNKLIIVTPRVHNFIIDKLNKEEPKFSVPKRITFSSGGMRVESGFNNSDEIIIDLIKMLTND